MTNYDIEHCKHKLIETGNRLYIWHAIWHCYNENIDLPDWCHEEVKRLAINLFMLSHGVDFRRKFTKEWDESDGDFARRVHARFYDGDRSPAGRELDAKKALEILPQCFDFGGQRKNAFRRVFNDREAEYDASFFSSMDRQGKKKEALKEIAERRNVDDRGARERVKRGLRLTIP